MAATICPNCACSEKLSASVDAGFRHDERLKALESDMRSPLTPSMSTLYSRSTLLEHSWRDVPSASAKAEYSLDEKDSMSGSFNWLRTGGPRNYTQTTATTDASETVIDVSNRLSRGHNPETSYDEQLEYTRKLEQQGEELDISLHRATSHQLTRYDYTNDSLLPAAASYDSYLIQGAHDAATEAGLDYVLPLSNSRELELGYLFEQDDYGFDSTAGDEDPLTGAEAVDSGQTDDFRYRQRIQAGYASYKASLGKWSFLAGLRLEDTTTDARVPTDNTVSRNHYLGLFPSLHVERSLSDTGTLSFGASRRVTRPDPQQLDPNINQEYTLILRAGNLRLLPEYTQSYQGYAPPAD